MIGPPRGVYASKNIQSAGNCLKRVLNTKLQYNYIVTISTVYHVCTGWNENKRWKLALLTLVKWVKIRMCVTVSWNVVVGCCRYGVGAPWRLAKLLMLWVGWSCWLMLVNLTGCVKSGGRVEHGGLCDVDGLTWLNMATCVKLSVLSNLASCRIVVLCQWVTTGRAVQSPLLPFQRDVVLVQRHLGRSLSTTSDTPQQQREGPTAIFWNFFCLWGWVPILFGHLPISDGMKKYAFLNSLFCLLWSLLFEWSWLISIVSREVWNIRSVLSTVLSHVKYFMFWVINFF